jgi:FkbM family methyltransferase
MKKYLKAPIRNALKKLRFTLSANNSPLFIGFYKYLYKPSKGSLSEFLSQYSSSKKGDFTVVQIGANDGITHDPIHKFIKRDKWKGVLLEPQPKVFNRYLKKIYARDHDIHTVCAALGPENGKRNLYQIGFSDMRWATGLASFNRENVEKAFNTGLVADRCAKHGINIPEDPAQQIISEEVDIINSDTLLDQYHIEQIDLLQIDTEGFDYEVIKMFNIEKSQPQAIIFEHVHLTERDMQSCLELLGENDYEAKQFGSNTLAVKKNRKY